MSDTVSEMLKLMKHLDRDRKESRKILIEIADALHAIEGAI